MIYVIRVSYLCLIPSQDLGYSDDSGFIDLRLDINSKVSDSIDHTIDLWGLRMSHGYGEDFVWQKAEILPLLIQKDKNKKLY